MLASHPQAPQHLRDLTAQRQSRMISAHYASLCRGYRCHAELAGDCLESSKDRQLIAQPPASTATTDPSAGPIPRDLASESGQIPYTPCLSFLSWIPPCVCMSPNSGQQATFRCSSRTNSPDSETLTLVSPRPQTLNPKRPKKPEKKTHELPGMFLHPATSFCNQCLLLLLFRLRLSHGQLHLMV